MNWCVKPAVAIGLALLCWSSGRAAGEEPQPARKKPPKLNIPIPVGHDSKGIKLPYYDGEGILRMSFSIGLAERMDEQHLRMKDAVVETYNDEGKREMSIRLPVSIFDLRARVISSKDPVTITRQDFEITGDSMLFNTQNRRGRLSGNIRMLIYDRGALENTNQ